jgi:hypothetical protein
VIAQAAMTHAATVIDLCTAFRAAPTGTSWIVDRIEPSRAGARAIAALLRSAIDRD